jgi:hypothetical protein
MISFHKMMKHCHDAPWISTLRSQRRGWGLDDTFQDFVLKCVDTIVHIGYSNCTDRLCAPARSIKSGRALGIMGSLIRITSHAKKKSINMSRHHNHAIQFNLMPAGSGLGRVMLALG